MKASSLAQNRVSGRAQGFSSRQVTKSLPYKTPRRVQKVPRAASDLVEGLRRFQQDATSDPSNNIVSLGNGQAARALHAGEKLSQELAVPENVASARAWIAAWKAKQGNAATTAAVPENVASARAWIAAWKDRNQAAGASDEEVQALRREVEKLKGRVSASEAAVEAVQAELRRIEAQRDSLASNLAQEVFGGATLRKQRDSALALAALSSGQGEVRATHDQQPKPRAQVAAAGLQGPAAGAAAPGPERLPKPAAATQPALAGGYTNTNRFWVPNQLESKFRRVVAERQAAMERANGFLGLAVREISDPGHAAVADLVLAVSSSWATVPDWEAWSGGRESLRHQLPGGVMQFPPRKGEGFPEDYVPFKDLAGEVPNAKY